MAAKKKAVSKKAPAAKAPVNDCVCECTGGSLFALRRVGDSLTVQHGGQRKVIELGAGKDITIKVIAK